jgi:D-amino peptidase
VGESGINALVADHYKVPIAFVSGDAITAEETRPFAAGAVNVITKESISRFSAKNLHPTESCQLIRAGAEEAVRKVAAGTMPLPQLSLPTALDLEMQTADMAAVATWAKGVERTGDRSVRIQNDNLLEMFESFVAVNYITRQAGGR